jgi:hypothetical protein
MNPSEKLADVGQDWSFETRVEALKERRRASKDAQRYWIARAVLGGIAVGLAALGWHGVQTDDFGPVSGFWTAAGPVFGTVVGYYFGKAGDDP